MYSYGVVAWEIVSRQDPLSASEMKGLDPFAKMFKVMNGYRDAVPSDTPKPLAEIITQCRDASPQKRPTAKEAVAMHLPFFKQGQSPQGDTRGLNANNAAPQFSSMKFN